MADKPKSDKSVLYRGGYYSQAGYPILFDYAFASEEGAINEYREFMGDVVIFKVTTEIERVWG